MINTDIEVVLIRCFLGPQIVVTANVKAGQRARETRLQIPAATGSMEPAGMLFVGTPPDVTPLEAAHATRISYRSQITCLSEVRIEDFTLVCLVAVAVENVQPS